MMYTMDATIRIILDPIVPLRLSQRNPKMICERRGVSSDACFFRRGCSNHEKDDDGCCCCSVSCCSNIVGDVHRYDRYDVVAPERYDVSAQGLVLMLRLVSNETRVLPSQKSKVRESATAPAPPTSEQQLLSSSFWVYSNDSRCSRCSIKMIVRKECSVYL
jgi:hypothetical protein